MPADLQKSVYNLYTSLNATLPLAANSGLGGKLIYAGELSGPGSQLLPAANIAGAASIAASADSTLQRQAIRDNVIDILVTSLEEALRILKNEIRKHQAVSVGVGIAPTLLVEQMLDRGVLPELIPEVSEMGSEQESIFLSQGARKIATSNPRIWQSDLRFVTWSVDRDFARILPKIDALAQSAIPDADVMRQRWLHLAPRYLGRAAQRIHSVCLSDKEFARFKSSVGEWKTQTVSEAGEPPALTLEISDLEAF